MKQYILKINFSVLALLLLMTACTKKDTSTSAPVTTVTDSVKMEFYHVVAGQGLNLSDQWYKNANGDSFMVSTFNYYVSNVVLTGDSGTADYVEANSYHLVEAPANSIYASAFDMQNVPVGHYKAVTFLLGVDSARNLAGAQTGALDPLNGMFWNWNSGYIMLKFEGTSPQASDSSKALEYHVLGFSGPNSVLRKITLAFPNDITTNQYMEPHIHFAADVDAMFNTPNRINFATESEMTSLGVQAKQLADNYANMFTITYVGF
jgi:hypothetical protein